MAEKQQAATDGSEPSADIPSGQMTEISTWADMAARDLTGSKPNVSDLLKKQRAGKRLRYGIRIQMAIEQATAPLKRELAEKDEEIGRLRNLSQASNGLDTKSPSGRGGGMMEDWQPMETAPKEGFPIQHVRGKLANGAIVEDMFFARDLSGEYQPPFEGWFISSGSFYREVDPVAWMLQNKVSAGGEKE